MKINTLDWDSTFFKIKVGEIRCENISAIDNSENFDMFYLMQKHNLPLEIDGFSLTYKETKIIFSKNMEYYHNDESNDIMDTDVIIKDAEYFEQLAFLSGYHSRFLLDKNFGTNSFKKLYKEWVINSLNKKFAKKIFYIEDNDRCISFITLQQCGNLGKIGLIATSEDYQGKGLAQKILKHTENYCIKNNIEKLEIPTQEENEQACRFYHKMGYKITEKLIIKHYWKSKLYNTRDRDPHTQ